MNEVAGIENWQKSDKEVQKEKQELVSREKAGVSVSLQKTLILREMERDRLSCGSRSIHMCECVEATDMHRWC